MKIYLSKINESWIIDRLKEEWISSNKINHANFRLFSDVVWLIAPWSLSKNYIKKIKNKKIIYSVYHIEEGLNNYQTSSILQNDKYIDAYHTISSKTMSELSKLTNKPIYNIPFWINQNLWFSIENKELLRKKYGFTKQDYLIGSFQRDTESHDLKTPKLVKGPDIFIKLIEKIKKQNKNLKIVLSGKNRNFIISELEKLNIPYRYFEMSSFEQLNELYNILDLYLVTSRLEGGPQAIMECGLTKTPIISTDVGISNEVLHKESIYDFNNLDTFFKAKPNIDFAFSKASNYIIPKGMNKYRSMFKEVYES